MAFSAAHIVNHCNLWHDCLPDCFESHWLSPHYIARRGTLLVRGIILIEKTGSSIRGKTNFYLPVDLEQSAEEHGPFGLRLQPAKAVKKYRLVDAYFD